MTVDLHLHSTVSDGTLQPAEIIEKASNLRLTTIALTDHDSFAGVKEAQSAARQYGVNFIPGVELSTHYNGEDIHVIGYYANPKNDPLNDKLSKLRDSRVLRARQIVDRLREIGVDIEWPSVEKLSKGEAVGRPHIAQALINKGLAADFSEVFKKYLGRGKPGYVSKHVLDIDDIFKLVHAAGGVTSLAHPGHCDVDAAIVSELKDRGLDGIEIWHVDHSENDVKRFRALAEKFDLVVTGGSDCHGDRKRGGPVMGTLDIPDSVIAPLYARVLKIRGHETLFS